MFPLEVGGGGQEGVEMEAERDVNMSVERAAKGDVVRDRIIDVCVRNRCCANYALLGGLGACPPPPPPPPRKLLPLWAGEKNFIRSQTGVLLLKSRRMEPFTFNIDGAVCDDSFS